jgi:hypothetical protein
MGAYYGQACPPGIAERPTPSGQLEDKLDNYVTDHKEIKVMKKSYVKQMSLTLGAMVAMGFASTASAQQVIVLNHYQEIPDKKTQFSQVIDDEVSKKLTGVKGLEWTKFFYNPSTGERGSIFLWKSQADWEAYLKSDLRKELIGKMKPFLHGDVSSKSYPVYEPKK